MNYGLLYRGDGRFELLTLEFTVFSDSDWAGDRESRKLTAVYVLLAVSAVISWSSKKL